MKTIIIKIIRIIISIILIFIAWFYLSPYVIIMFSPFSWSEVDISKNGIVSPGEAGYFSDYGKRQYIENGKSCTEYFSLKDGMPLKKVCQEIGV